MSAAGRHPLAVVIRAPRAALRPFVHSLWVSSGAGLPSPGAREHSIPTGRMHLVIRTTGEPVRIFAGAADREGQTCGPSVVAGPRSTFHIKDVATPAHAVGAELHPAASLALFGAPADLLAHRHLPLDAVWPAAAAGELRERLALAPGPQRQLDVLEAALAGRLPRVQGLHPAVALALDRLDSFARIADVVRESGYSHRTFSLEFRRAMGLGPKRFLRVRRMADLLHHLGNARWADLAAEAGFSDQAHMVREFVAFTGVTPTCYRALRPPLPHHVRIQTQDGHGGGPRDASRSAATRSRRPFR